MTNKFVEEAPYHPGYEDAAFKNEVSQMLVELGQFRKMNAHYLNFSTVIVDLCKSSKLDSTSI